MRLLLALALLVAACAGACALLDTDPPTNTCKSDTDCFRAQGEYCNTKLHECVPGDAGVDAP